LLIVDEAHHLEWNRDGVSASYRLVEALAGQTEGVLLLTATPQQLGRAGHFARLRLLDPDRYENLERFLEEADHYEEVADAIGRLQAGGLPSDADVELFGKKSGGVMRHVEALRGGDEEAREQLVGELVDEFGTGRVMFRHTRAALSGFPERKANLVELAGEDEEEAKIDWLVDLLVELDDQKVLLICKTQELAEGLSEKLREKVEIPCALFHEGLSLLQRDRNAAYFAEEDEGARVLFCSEIGSEGRNFQFAHHLVLYDLPENPELLEQRIGRLDRIGQTATIHIHVPYLKGGRGEVLARWFHEGLGALEKSLHGAAEISRALKGELATVESEGLEGFLEKSRLLTAEVAGKLERGYDRLLELNSTRVPKPEELIEAIEAADEEAKFEGFVVKVMDHYGVNLEELDERSYYLRPGDLTTDAFPAIPEEGLSVTFDRKRALGREDIGFMTKDHPIVRGAMDLLLGSEAGNSAFGVWEGSGEDALLLEVYGVLECVAPASLHADRFLPATPIRVVVDHQLADRTGTVHLAKAKLRRGNLGKVLEKPAIKQQFLPAMLKKGQELVEMVGKKVSTKAAGGAEKHLDEEIERLKDLQAINDHVQPDEIEGLEAQKTALVAAVSSARVRLDAVRIVLRKR
ncbi:MAG: helicase-related protein, partial [Verrucomicrobiales bacterium]|nr:helicase-related protein [Verrucomicrobiales bacterium]